MIRYPYRSFFGHTIHRYFPRGQAPKAVGLFSIYKRIIIYPRSVTFKGGIDAGWNRNQLSDKPDYKVTWGTVEKFMRQADQIANINEEKKTKRLNAVVSDLVSDLL